MKEKEEVVLSLRQVQTTDTRKFWTLGQTVRNFHNDEDVRREVTTYTKVYQL